LTDLHEGDKTEQWAEFIKTKCKKQLAIIGKEYPHFRSLMIDYKEVEKFGPVGLELADQIVESPGKTREDIIDAVFGKNLIKTSDGKPPKKLNIRFIGLRKRTALHDLRYDNVNRMVSVEITILRVSEVRPKVTEAVFKCPSGHFTTLQQKYGKFTEPTRGCSTTDCNYKILEFVDKRSDFVNQQSIKIIENTDGLKAGQQPQTLEAVALDDICETVFPGDRAVMNGIIRSVQRIVKGEKSTVFDLYLEVSSIEAEKRDFDEVEITDESVEQIKEIAKCGKALEMIAASIAPSIYGYDDIKRGIALQMFGGVSSTNEDGTVNRGDIHILILGDPGVAKSKLIKYASKQSPRGVFVSCTTATAVGLTGMAARDENGKYTIEAGALPLADMGVAAIDEIDKADASILDSILNLMEDGEVQITKAGKNRVLKARCSLICAGNPKHERFDMIDEDIISQIDIPPAFMSRIDLPYLMIDTPERVIDEKRSRHVIKSRYIAECRAAGKMDRITKEELEDVQPPIPTALLKQYIAYARRTTIPIMNPQVREYLTTHYLEIRGKPIKATTSPATMRQQEALVRLAEASAKIRLSPEVVLKDAETAVNIFTECMKAIATDPRTGEIDPARIGMGGVPQMKIDMIGAMREILKNEPRCSKPLLLARMAERSFKNENSIANAIERGIKDGDIMDRGMNEHYDWVGK
jgi:replicative DNA helicase Mcm